MTRRGDQQNSDSDWQAIPDHIREAMKYAWSNGMPPLSSAVYGRWWQLETWLRSLVYIELRAAHGARWANSLPKHYVSRQYNDDNEFRYMATPDAQNLLAYADASALFNITLNNWELFKHALLSKSVWAGRIEELLAIRNRIGHCRRPHSDDLARLEQTLRDIDGGAFIATSTFNEQWQVGNVWSDLLIDGWVRNQHEVASRLVEHASGRYDTRFELRCSQRPWAPALKNNQTISGVPGYLWHAFWYFRGGRGFNLERFWREIERVADNILLVSTTGPSSISVSFAAMEDPAAIADTIGHCFDAALLNIQHGFDPNNLEAWLAQYAELDPRVHVATPWAVVEASMRGTTIFCA